MIYPYRYAPHAQVLGAGMSAIFNHYRREAVLASLKTHGLDYLEPDEWYEVDKFIEVFAEWHHLPAFTTNYVSVGMALIYHMEALDELDAVDPLQKLLLLGDLHVAQHRAGEVGRYKVTQLTERHIVYEENMVWPDDLIYGYIYGATQHILRDQTSFVVTYDEKHQRQEYGGQSTLIHLMLDA